MYAAVCHPGCQTSAGLSPESINDFVGSTQAFTSAVRQDLEQSVLREALHSQLTWSQLKLLKLVSLAGGHTIGALAASLGVSAAAASKAADKLVRRRLLRRPESRDDRRESELSLTETGRRLLAAYDSRRERKLAEALGQFAQEELHRTAGVLDRMSAAILGLSGKPPGVCCLCGIYFRQTCLLRDLVPRICPQQALKRRSG